MASCIGPDEPPERITEATTPQCAAPEVQDSGHVVYVLVERDCPAAAGPLTVSFTVRKGDRPGATSRHTITLADFGVEARVLIGEGLERTVSVHRKGTWRSFPNPDSWGWRDGAGLLVKDGVLFLLGGYRGGTGSQNEVWSSENVREWKQLLAEAPWSGRHGAGWVVHDRRLFVISGDLTDDVWSSADGVEWTMDTVGAPFGGRYTPNAVSTGRGILLYGGQDWGPSWWCAFLPECYAVGMNDVWFSPDGTYWTEALRRAPWEGRGLVHGAAYFKGRVYVVGGGLKLGLPGITWAETIQEFADIWSSDDGVRWVKEADTLGFTPRTHFSITSSPKGCFVSDGSVGTQGNFSNDVFFAPDCVHFAPIPDAPPLQKRHASSLTYFNGSIVILGGPPYAGPETTAGTTVWQYFPDI